MRSQVHRARRKMRRRKRFQRKKGIGVKARSKEN